MNVSLIKLMILLIVEKTKYDVLGLNDYLQKDRFNADEFSKNIEKNLRNARVAWTTSQYSDNYSVNERVKEY